MDALRRLPAWAWWAAAAALGAAAVAALILVNRAVRPDIPPGLVERRGEISALLEALNQIEDVQLAPLADLETTRDYRAAVELVDRAIAANARREEVAAAIVRMSEELAVLALGVKPDGLGAQAVESFAILTALASTERQFYEHRRSLYEVSRNYYAELAAKRSPPFPEELLSLAETIERDLARATELRREFAAALKAFDAAVR